MNPQVKDLTGKRFSMLTVKAYAGVTKGAHALWSVVCDCGVEKVVTSAALIHRSTLSCGCWRRKRLSVATKTHGDSYSVEFKAWYRMMNRCYKENDHAYHYYGGRGITVCKRWHKYANFLTDMGRKQIGMSIERINNNKGYSPKNCKWGNIDEQNNNKRGLIKVSYNNKTQTCGRWAKELGLPYHIVLRRVKAGYSIQEIINKPKLKEWNRHV